MQPTSTSGMYETPRMLQRDKTKSAEQLLRSMKVQSLSSNLFIVRKLSKEGNEEDSELLNFTAFFDGGGESEFHEERRAFCRQKKQAFPSGNSVLKELSRLSIAA